MNSQPANTDRGSILVVDDSPENLRVLSASLTTLGYKIRCVTNGEMALISVKSSPPDLILLDIRMPILDGYEVCRRLKTNPDTKDIPIIFLSALDDVVDKVKAFEMGGVDYVTKPFQAAEIIARIAHQLTIQRLQNQLSRQNQQLQQEIEAHKRTEAVLQDAKESAEIANHAKGQFFARMSHELRTPLNTILGFSGLMTNDKTLTKDHQDYVSSIHKSARNLLEMINQILTITRAESSQISLNTKDFNFYSFLGKIISDWQPQAQSKGLEFNVSISPNVPQYIHTDDSKLQQILTQVLKNSIQFTMSGQINIDVTLGDSVWQDFPSNDHPNHHSQRPAGVLSFIVKDTGCGINHHQVNQLFQAFAQSGSQPQLEQGLGLGLYISHQYIQALGGQINLTSTPGQGTKVEFHLPIKLATTVLNSAPVANSAEVEMLGQESPAGSEISLEAIAALMAEALATEGISMDWVARLHKAATQGFDQQITALIQQVPDIYLPLAAVLAEWNRNFQFESILTITQRILDQSR